MTDTKPNAKILTDAINRAASDLEGQGERSDRIACQLLTALARYEAEQGDPLALALLAEQGEIAEPRYRLEWCRWEHGGGADMQEWHSQAVPKKIDCGDEHAMRHYAQALDLSYAPTFKHRVVLDV